PRVPFVAPTGIRWVRIDRGSGKRVYGTFPVQEDPKSEVIWEAFQPQTEPRRSYRGVQGDPYGEQAQQQAAQARAAVRQGRQLPSTEQSNGLQTVNGVY